MIVEPARRDELLALMEETYGTAMSADEFDWWLADRIGLKYEVTWKPSDEFP